MPRKPVFKDDAPANTDEDDGYKPDVNRRVDPSQKDGEDFDNGADDPVEEGPVEVTPSPKEILARVPKVPNEKKKYPYVVTGGMIAPDGNKAVDIRAGAQVYRAGDTVELTRDQAIHYNNIRRLGPFIPGEDE